MIGTHERVKIESAELKRVEGQSVRLRVGLRVGLIRSFDVSLSSLVVCIRLCCLGAITRPPLSTIAL